MKENHYNQGALSGGSEHFNSAQKFRRVFEHSLTTCLCKDACAHPPVLTHTKAGILRDFSLHHTGIFSLLQLADQLGIENGILLIRKEMEFEPNGMKSKPQTQTRTYREDNTSIERQSRQQKHS